MHGEHADIDGALRALVAERLHLDPGEVAADASLQGLGVDSAALLDLIIGVEDAFEIDVPDQDVTLDNFGSVGAIRRYVVGRIEA